MFQKGDKVRNLRTGEIGTHQGHKGKRDLYGQTATVILENGKVCRHWYEKDLEYANTIDWFPSDAESRDYGHENDPS